MVLLGPVDMTLAVFFKFFFLAYYWSTMSVFLRQLWYCTTTENPIGYRECIPRLAWAMTCQNVCVLVGCAIVDK